MTSELSTRFLIPGEYVITIQRKGVHIIKTSIRKHEPLSREVVLWVVVQFNPQFVKEGHAAITNYTTHPVKLYEQLCTSVIRLHGNDAQSQGTWIINQLVAHESAYIEVAVLSTVSPILAIDDTIELVLNKTQVINTQNRMRYLYWWVKDVGFSTCQVSTSTGPKRRRVECEDTEMRIRNIV